MKRLLATVTVIAPLPQHAQAVSVGEGEAKKCEERIAAVQRDVLNKYEDSLAELQATFQTAADLKEEKLSVRGTVGRFRPGPANAKQYVVFLGGNTPGIWVQCVFAASEFQFREETQFNNSILILSTKGKDARTVRCKKARRSKFAESAMDSTKWFA